jgi:hypothetical protein
MNPKNKFSFLVAKAFVAVLRKVEGQMVPSETEVRTMQTKARNPDDCLDHETSEELAGVLTAISVVSKRLAKRLVELHRQDGANQEGGKSDGEEG